MAPRHHRDVPNNKLNSWFANTKSPVIMSAPMLGVANGALAAAVSKAGGLGFIPGGLDFTPHSAQLATLADELTTARRLLGLADRMLTPLPVGVGFILSHASLVHFEETAIPLLQDHSPQAVWLFAPHPEHAVSGLVRRVVAALKNSGFIVIFQVGNVASARQAALDGADIIVAQGADAGGHQFAGGAGIVSLVPEVVSMLEREFAGHGIVVAAAGGIVDGRGVAAALALGAEAVVMGTRFLIAPEASTAEFQRKLVIETEDGGPSTSKSSVHDDLYGVRANWPSPYDGRAIIGEPWRDHLKGVPLEENIKKNQEAKAAGDVTRLVTWAGTGVGLVKDALPAGDIVREVREAAQQRIKQLQTLF
ncbi:FMN-dependent 2-nitropropane dioxygenase [Lasiosphaeria hispida]|uniref:FMN-dependent 2-nitropropane dioxygenase n=1 Tax=Lasiosphaeria hispida TaxID=260671 RepID=A0AAJ0MD01_9PEZI|nr:FMN-dependent 2-nitropropane dioxygenase [Lasiosphaeria hispida]